MSVGARLGPFLLCLVLLLPDAAGGADLAGWDAARWGMTSAEILHLYGKRATHLTGRLDFGRFYTDVVLKHANFAGLDVTVYFQMSDKTGRLAQVLLERRRQAATPAAWHEMTAALTDQFGAATTACTRAGAPELVWAFPTTTIRASYIDMPLPEVNAQLSTMSRILIRYSPTEKGAAACP